MIDITFWQLTSMLPLLLISWRRSTEDSSLSGANQAIGVWLISFACILLSSLMLCLASRQSYLSFRCKARLIDSICWILGEQLYLIKHINSSLQGWAWGGFEWAGRAEFL